MNTLKILITGGSGFIGTNAIDFFRTKGFEILNLDIKPPQNHLHEQFWSQCDILDLNTYKKLSLEFNPDYFLHLAARTDLQGKTDLSEYAANIEGVQNTVEVVNSCPRIQRTIFASSRMVCRIDYQPRDFDDYCPPNLYGESKMIGEKIVKKSRINGEWLMIRPTSIWGPWFDVPYKIFFTTIKHRRYFNPGDHNPSKSFGYVGNTVWQLDKLLFTKTEMVNQKIFYLCDYPPLQLRTWAELIRKEMKIKPIPTIPYFVLKGMALIGDGLSFAGWYRVPLTSFRLNNLITNMVYDTQDLEKICGNLPFTLEEGVSKTVKFMNLN